MTHRECRQMKAHYNLDSTQEVKLVTVGMTTIIFQYYGLKQSATPETMRGILNVVPPFSLFPQNRDLQISHIVTPFTNSKFSKQTLKEANNLVWSSNPPGTSGLYELCGMEIKFTILKKVPGWKVICGVTRFKPWCINISRSKWQDTP